MLTRRFIVDPENLFSSSASNALEQAAQILREGGLVAFPTETVYGLGANALLESAAQRIFAAKQRPAWDPLIVHISDRKMLETLVLQTLAPVVYNLVEVFWPGPLTLLLPRSGLVPDAVTAGRQKVGIRMPAHPVAQQLIRLAGVPIAAPSANRFGRTSPTLATHVLQDLDGRIDAVIDAGPAQLGMESTVLDPLADPPVIYRPGMITLEQIREYLPGAVFHKPEPVVDETARGSLPAPGVGLRHYAPRARLILIEGVESQTDDKDGTLDVHSLALLEGLAEAEREVPRNKIGILLPEDFPLTLPAKVLIYKWGRWSLPEQLAAHLFAGLRELDQRGCEVILCPVPQAGGIGQALRDRLAKASRPKE